MKPILIIKTGGTFQETVAETGDFEDWTRRGMGLAPEEVSTVPVFEGASLPSPASLCAAVITGSHAMVTDGSPWIAQTARWLQGAVAQALPVLGICFGHQLLADALGGQTGWNPRGREIGTVPIVLTAEGRQDPLLGALPARFPAHVTHRQSAIALPPGAALLASSELDPHQAFRLDNAWGVQFHPEFSAEDIRYYIERLDDEIRKEGHDPGLLSARIESTADATSVLARFTRFAKGEE